MGMFCNKKILKKSYNEQIEHLNLIFENQFFADSACNEMKSLFKADDKLRKANVEYYKIWNYICKYIYVFCWGLLPITLVLVVYLSHNDGRNIYARQG